MRSSGAGRDVAFACCLTLVLTLGVVGVLLFNTAMQQQSHRITVQHERIAALLLQAQQEATRLDELSDPTVLAARAHALHLRPATSVRYVDVTGRRRVAGRAHAG